MFNTSYNLYYVAVTCSAEKIHVTVMFLLIFHLVEAINSPKQRSTVDTKEDVNMQGINFISGKNRKVSIRIWFNWVNKSNSFFNVANINWGWYCP